MARRPPSSSASSRPYTAGGQRPGTSARPGTSTGGPGAPGYYEHDPYAVYEDDEEDESEPEDVFAYLPPDTADAAPPASAHAPFAAPPAPPPFAHHHPHPAPAPHAPTAHLPSVPYHAAPPEAAPPPPIDAHTRPPPSAASRPADTPPSTGSQHAPHEDGLRMRRLDAPPPATPVSSARPPSSREVHISLPGTAGAADEKAARDRERDGGGGKGKHHQPMSSAGGSAASAAMSPSLLDGDDASIK